MNLKINSLFNKKEEKIPKPDCNIEEAPKSVELADIRFTNNNIKRDNIKIGDYTYGVPKIYMWTNRYQVIIGKFCSIAENVTIIVDGNHRLDWVSTYPFGHLINGIPINEGHPQGKGNISIGNDVWIGQDVLILPGITIGDGAIIGAGSVVTKNVGDYEVIGGNPAKHIKFRFTEDQIKSLKNIKWWDWPIEKIKANVVYIESPDIDMFITIFLNE